MTELIDKSIGLQSMGFSEMDAWKTLLAKNQFRLIKAYKVKDYKLVKTLQLNIDFIQKQIIRVRAIS